jgi:hypothetical protein
MSTEGDTITEHRFVNVLSVPVLIVVTRCSGSGKQLARDAPRVIQRWHDCDDQGVLVGPAGIDGLPRARPPGRARRSVVDLDDDRASPHSAVTSVTAARAEDS